MLPHSEKNLFVDLSSIIKMRFSLWMLYASAALAPVAVVAEQMPLMRGYGEYGVNNYHHIGPDGDVDVR